MNAKTNRRKISLDKLIVHPGNVRAPASYSQDGLEALMTSIETLGLLQPPVVQALPGGQFGALIGGRRITALQGLREEGRIDYSAIECIVIDADVPHVTAMSLAENVTQERMHALDEFAAFARMTDDGMSIADIARSFGLTERHVRERLTYGRIHPEIRAAYRDRSLDALKAYGCNPDTEAQLSVYTALDHFERGQAHIIRARLEKVSVLASNPRAEFILDRYRAAGGPMIEALFPENSVLQDSALVDKLLIERLQEEAEAIRADHGLGWTKVLPAPDFALLAHFTTIRPQERTLTADEDARLDQLCTRLDEIEGEHAQADSAEAAEALANEAEALQAEIDHLQRNAYDPAEAAGAGVIVWWQNGPQARIGLVERAPVAPVAETPTEADNAEAFPDATDPGEDAEIEADAPEAITYSARLVEDLGLERAEIATLALTEAGPLASKAALFTVAVIGLTGSHPKGLLLTRENAWTRHSGGQHRDTPILTALGTATAALSLDWLTEATPERQFRAFCALTEPQREAILAIAVGKLLSLPMDAQKVFSFGEVIASAAMTSIRSLWTPDLTFWSRLTRPQMLAVLRDLGMPNMAAGMAAAKKADLVGYMTKLFAGADIGLNDAQRAAVDAWTPEDMDVLPPEGGTAADPVDQDGTTQAEEVPLLLEAAE